MSGEPESVTRGARVLVALFFWRSLDLEGGAGLVAGIARALSARNCSVTFLLPTRPAWMAPTADVVPFVASTPLGTASRYRRLLREQAARVDWVLLLENNALSHLLLAGRLVRGARAAVHLSSPTVGGGILRRGLGRQGWAHWAGKSRRLARLFGRVVGFSAPLYVVSTEYQKRDLVALGCEPERIEVLPYGVDPELFPPPAGPPPRRDRTVLGYLGHFSPIKGVQDLIEAFDLLAAGDPNVELRLAWSGKGRDSERVLARIEASAHRDRISLQGRVDVAAFVRELDVMVLPFRSGSIPHPPLVLLEAFASGVPVVTSRVGGLAEAVVDGETGFVADPGDARGLARALETICRQPELRARMRERVLAEAANRYSTGHLCDVLLARMAEPADGGARAT